MSTLLYLITNERLEFVPAGCKGLVFDKFKDYGDTYVTVHWFGINKIQTYELERLKQLVTPQVVDYNPCGDCPTTVKSVCDGPNKLSGRLLCLAANKVLSRSSSN